MGYSPIYLSNTNYPVTGFHINLSKKNLNMRQSLISITILLFAVTFTSAQWDDCPFGEVDDTYPGLCGRYIDTDNDDICDRSQPAPEDRFQSESVEDSTNIEVDAGSIRRTFTVGCDEKSS